MPFESRRSDSLRFYLSWPGPEGSHAALKDQDGALRSLAREDVYDTEGFAKDGHLYAKGTIKAKGLRTMLRPLPKQVVHYSEEREGKIQVDHYSILLDFFFRYDQFLFDVESKDMIAIQTLIGLLRMTRILIRATNSIAQFVKVIYKILIDCIPNVCLLYINDVRVKRSRSFYNYEEVLPGIRRFVLKHI
ncbi:gag-pol polyprotein [Drepanopeziza brunnea f. sp. 'multigermtubi' MB_m1]|uniref:Gag-pol polyprotein n=1 Tax=Marssonina brunnea f. sp. multigermtubi (strain MB_m1) TaxID=1072389 RepID=K1WB42_MARBU|nr:gag-pol polyprotein [Drepanopeziza brunnea f. sp. 'multigermtubi' MB_m1]EKD14520.1 gag-pol polyprotein [Drepanopeziza brunnea f. sp. 'multigermtubi' MB_m1]